jgi:F-type H+-transporting ATPase subunit alpha
MKRVAGGMRLDLAQFRSLAAFAQFGSNLDRATQRQLDRGLRLTELLKQPQYQPYQLNEMVALIFAGTNGFLDEVPVARVRQWKDGFLRFMNTQYAELVSSINTEQKMTDEVKQGLSAALNAFNEQWS